MKNRVPQRFVCALAVLFLQAGPVKAQPALSLDDFNQRPNRSYSGYAPGPGAVQEGYGVYYEMARARLSRVQVISANATNQALRIQYELPPYFPWGNWLSIRREFESPLDLSQYRGLEMNLKVEAPSEARLRITLSDIENLGEHEDEMWWFDFDPGLLKNGTRQWITLRAPFEGFYLSWGGGTRQNDGKRNLSKIVAFEINLISPSQEHPKGTILVDFLHAYK